MVENLKIETQFQKSNFHNHLLSARNLARTRVRFAHLLCVGGYRLETNEGEKTWLDLDPAAAAGSGQ